MSCIAVLRPCVLINAPKVRCDAASLGVPCTNCVAFSIECKIPVPKRKKTATGRIKDEYRLGTFTHKNSRSSPADIRTIATMTVPRIFRLAANHQNIPIRRAAMFLRLQPRRIPRIRCQRRRCKLGTRSQRCSLNS